MVCICAVWQQSEFQESLLRDDVKTEQATAGAQKAIEESKKQVCACVHTVAGGSTPVAAEGRRRACCCTTSQTNQAGRREDSKGIVYGCVGALHGVGSRCGALISHRIIV